MIYICYGQPKSASTAISRLTARIIHLKYGVTVAEIGKKYLPQDLRTAFIGQVHRVIDRLDNSIPRQITYRVKTHGPPTAPIDELLASRQVLACVSFRDPRDVALSMLDAGVIDRREGRGRSFSNFHTFDDVFSPIRRNLKILKLWLAVPGVTRIPYELVASQPAIVAQRIIRQMGFDDVDANQAARSIVEKKESIPEFNKGIVGRYKTEMPEPYQEKFDNEFGDDIRLIQKLTQEEMQSTRAE
ncbi:hypothetical protein [Bauldia sp.]|uniref:hypothetical protein n=1 Tax=Bauldia sp. TaxID=2575872 RepID=UPI003BACD18B